MTSGGTGKSGSGADTSRFTIRRLRSTFYLWRTSIRATDLLIAAVFVALSLGLGAYVFARARASVHLAFAQKAQQLLARVTERLSSTQENLYTLQSFMAADRVSRDQFRLISYPMLARNREVYAFEWMPFARQSERKAYEAEARASHMTDYQFWEEGPGGKQVVAGSRAFYVPILYMEPPSLTVLGFDIASSPMRWNTASAARSSGEVVASPPFWLFEDVTRHGAPVIAAYAPVYREGDPGSPESRLDALKGFAAAIFRVSPLVDKAASEVDASGLGLLLHDMESPGSPPLAERPAGAAKLPRRAGFELPFPVGFGSRSWRLEVFPLPGAFEPSQRGAIEAGLLGILVSLIGLVTWTSLRTIARLRRQAEKVGPYRL
ncbi:MAG TPA: CHASE domain-containing protein, partial [Thermoanaerobaculia bacterium]